MSINNQNTYLNIEDAHLRLRTGNVYAQGITIGGITVDPSHGLQRVSDTGNVTTNTLQFDNATTAFTTTANATVGRDLTVTGNATVSSNLTVTGSATVSSNLTVTGNAVVSDDLTVTENLFVSNNLTVTGNTFYTNPAAVLVDSNVVTEYTGPHDRPLRKYPEVAMTSASQGGYVVTASSEYTTGNKLGVFTYYAWKLFDEISGGFVSGETWINGSFSAYDSNGDYVLSPANNLGTGADDGEWVKLELPVKIRLERIRLISRDESRAPKEIKIYGSNDNVNWVEILSDTNSGEVQTFGIPYTDSVYIGAYKYLGLVIKKVIGTGGYFAIDDLEYYGREEGSGSLDTTLKSVYNVPATTGTQLEVYYDAKDLTTMPATVTDLSPESNDGSVSGNPQVSNGAFGFDGSGDAIVSSGTSTSLDGNATFSISLWSKTNTVSSGSNALFMLGYFSTNKSTGLRIDASTGKYRFFTTTGVSKTSPTTALLNEWTHITLIHEGTSGYKFYVNGVFTDEITVDNDLSLDSNPRVALGNYINASGVVTGTASYDGSIANFRLYSKALNADQVKELYDYQKDYFLGSKSQVTLYKGHLGVGVTEPSGQLELAGDERIQEYPPRGLVGDPLVFDPAGNAYDYNVEGHGVFKLLSSYNYHASTSDDRRIYEFFDKDVTVTQSHWSSFNSSAPYDAAGGSGAWVTTLDGGSTITAHIAEIQMPYKITLKKYNLTSGSQVPRALKTGMIVGSNDGNVYHVLHNVSDFGFTAVSQTKEYTVDNATTPYRIFRLLLMNTNGHVACNMRQWRLFGTPGPTTLDKGSLSLTRSLDVPRVSRYDVDTETPRPEKLVVDFDTTVNESPTDISGQGNHGAFYNMASKYLASEKAFTFDGTDDHISTNEIVPSMAGAQPHTMSVWFKPTTVSGLQFITCLGEKDGGGAERQFSAIRLNGSTLQFWTYSNDLGKNGVITAGVWHHAVAVYVGGATSQSTMLMYLNGEKITNWDQDTTDGQALGFVSPSFALGEDIGRSGYYFAGQISNPKLYNVALEPSEVKKLYNLGRTGRSMVISDTAVGIGKVPEAQLDVRGNLNVDGVIKSNSPAFSAYEHDGYSETAAGYVTLGNTFVNKGGCYDTSNGIFTAPISGTYRFTVDATLRSYSSIGNGSGATTITLYINNANWNPTSTSRPLIYQAIDPGTNHQHVSGSLVRNLNAGDTVRIYGIGVASGTDINWGNGYGRFIGYLIS